MYRARTTAYNGVQQRMTWGRLGIVPVQVNQEATRVAKQGMGTSEFRRRSIRLQGADYTRAGGYFVTICAAEGREIFGRIQDSQIALSRLGEIVRGCWVQIPEHFAHAIVKEFVVMPNHLHGIIALGVEAQTIAAFSQATGTTEARTIVPVNQRGRTTEAFQKPVKGSIPTIIRTFKAAVARQAGKELGLEGRDIWHRNYFERVLRDGKEYVDASRYVMENPMRWEWDEENLGRGMGLRD